MEKNSAINWLNTHYSNATQANKITTTLD